MRLRLLAPFLILPLQAQAPTVAFFQGPPLTVAQVCIQKALALKPKEVDHLLLAMRVASAQGDAPRTEELFLAAQKRDPKNVDVYVIHGQSLLDRGDLKAAKDQFHLAQTLKPENVDLCRQIWSAWLPQDRKAALDQVERAKPFAPKDPGSAGEFAVALMDAGFSEEAQAMMALAIQDKPVTFDAAKDFGSACLRARRLEEANLWFGRATAVNPRKLDLWKGVALAYADHTLPEDRPAVKARMLEAARIGFPSTEKDKEALAELARVHLMAGERDKAEELFHRIAMSKEISAAEFRLVGWACLRAGLEAEAFKAYEAVRDARSSGGVIGFGGWRTAGAPGQPALFGGPVMGFDLTRIAKKNALGDSAVDLASKGFYDKAIPFMEEAFLMDAEDYDWLVQFGSICLKARKPESAARFFAKAAQGSPKDADCWVTLARAHLDFARTAASSPAAPTQ